MNTEQLLFYFFAALTLGSALLVVTLRNLVRSIFLFFVTIFSLSAMFIFALADFIAVTELVIYAGGVLVLMLFAFMLSDRKLLNNMEDFRLGLRLRHAVGLLICGGMFFLLYTAVVSADVANLNWIQTKQPISPQDNTIHQIGILTMTRYLLPFEVVSVFLLMALIGAAHLSRKEKGT